MGKNVLFVDGHEDDFGRKIVKKDVYALASSLVKRLFPSENVDSSSLSNDSNSAMDVIDMCNPADGNELRAFIAQREALQIQDSSFKTLKEEFNFWEKNPNPMTMPETLEKLLKAMQGIQVASVEPERVFSCTGSFVTKCRARLTDTTVDSLVFLKKHFDENKICKNYLICLF